ncbi:MAG: ribose 5-phosphate isomerase B [Clostridiales Family XIII bacterium]|jgi:ribose 5-phosphate isomerase B|nr:ribose 5-phosphate isomerase B [Clostridiales Family XIII bacterium]
MKIALASDHGALELKAAVQKHLEDRGIEATDIGTFTEDSTDYPFWGQKCGQVVASGDHDLGIVLCGSGIGISIAANKVKGIRCALVTSEELAFLAKNHNNANIIALGGRTTEIEDAILYVDKWLDTEFDGGPRHVKRIGMLNNM